MIPQWTLLNLQRYMLCARVCVCVCCVCVFECFCKSLWFKDQMDFKRLYEITFLLKCFLKSIWKLEIGKAGYCMAFWCHMRVAGLQGDQGPLAASKTFSWDSLNLRLHNSQALFALFTLLSFMNVQRSFLEATWCAVTITANGKYAWLLCFLEFSKVVGWGYTYMNF